MVVSWFKLQRNNPSFKSSSNQELNSEQLLKLYQDAIKLNKLNSQTSDYDGELSSGLESSNGPTDLQLANNMFRYIQINGTIDSKFTIENRMLEQFDDSQMQSILTIHRLDAEDSGNYLKYDFF